MNANPLISNGVGLKEFRFKTLSFGLDQAEMPGGSDIRAQPAEHDPGNDQESSGLDSQARQFKATAIQARDPTHRIAKRGQNDRGDDPRENAAADAIPEATVEEWPTNESVASADEFRNLDFFPTVLNVETDRIADDHDNAEPEEDARQEDSAADAFEDRVEPFNPRGIELHDVDGWKLAQIGRKARYMRGCGVGLGRAKHERMRQRILVERVDRLTESGFRAERLERIVRCDEICRGDVSTLSDSLGDSTRLVGGCGSFEVHRDTDRSIPSTRCVLRVRYEQV